MHLRTFEAANEFQLYAMPLLLQDEATNNLFLALLNHGVRHPAPPGALPYMAAVEVDGAPIALAWLNPGRRLVLTAATPPTATAHFATDLVARRVRFPGLLAPQAEARAFLDRWEADSGRSSALHMAQGIYQLDQVLHPRPAPGRRRLATANDLPLGAEWLDAFAIEVGDGSNPTQSYATVQTRIEEGALHLWEDEGEPVAMAAVAGETPNGIRVGMVYTPPAARGRGYASNLVASLSQAMLDTGRRFCFLFTDLGNPTSNHIYQEIGYRFVCEVEAHDFEPAP